MPSCYSSSEMFRVVLAVLLADAESVICAFAFHKLLIYSNLYLASFFRGTNWGQKSANQKKKRTNMKVFLMLFDSRLFLVNALP